MSAEQQVLMRTPARLMIAALLAAAALGGCKAETGLIVEVQGPLGGGSSVADGITKLDFVVAHPSWCERWVGVDPANHTTRDVSGRELSTKPYDLLITPSHTTDLSEQMYVAALAYGADGTLIGEAGFDAHPLAKGEVLKRTAQIFEFHDTKAGAQYVAGDGACVCTPGEPWVGNGSGSGCDTRVLTSFDRLIDTAGCELTPKGAPPPVPVCDGQQFLDEPADRRLPCWNKDDQGVCRVATRGCADHNGIAYVEECNVDSGDLMLPADTALCDRYRACQQSACTDVIGCVRGMFTQKATMTCKLPIDPTTAPDEPIRPCPNGGSWTATLPTQTTGGPSCPAAMLDGVAQPPYVFGFQVAGKTGPQTLASTCPNTFVVQKIDAPYPEAVPNQEFDIVSGEHLVHVTLEVVRQCVDGALSLVCSSG